MHKSISHARDSELRRVLRAFPCDPTDIEQITGGFVNQTFLVSTPKGKLVLRESNPEKTRAHLEFEIAVLNYLGNKKFPLTARPRPGRNGGFIVKSGGRFYTMQNFLPGSVKASWMDLRGLTRPRLTDMFAASARFTKAVSGFSGHAPPHSRTIGTIADAAAADFDRLLRATPKGTGKKLLEQQRISLHNYFDATRKLLRESGYADQPGQAVHFDLQPGNFHFSGNKTVGIFDFDWARRDSRLVDLAGTICQSCYHDRGPKAGLYRIDRMKLGLAAYNRAWGKNDLHPKEMVRLLTAIQRAYDTYQFLFIVEWHAKNARAPRALAYLKQFMNLQLVNDHAALFKAAFED